MPIRCDVCRRGFARDLDRGCLAWAFNSPREQVQRVWIVCSEHCLEALGDLPLLLSTGGTEEGRSTMQLRLSAPPCTA